MTKNKYLARHHHQPYARPMLRPQHLRERYEARYTHRPLLLRAPGRINLIGDHTDYNQGLVLPAAIDRSLYFALGPHPDPQAVEVHSVNFDQTGHFHLDALHLDPAGWLRYLQAVCRELQEHQYPLRGFRCVFGGNIPIGSGLSSSAALTCGLIAGLAQVQAWKIPLPEVARIAQAAEHRVGIRCGLMDQYAVLFGRANQVLQLDCRHLQVEHFPCDLGEYGLLLLNTKVEHELASTAYNDRRASCERVLEVLRRQYPEVESLRDVRPEQLRGQAPDLAEDLRRVRFVLSENERVSATTVALQRGDLPRVGQLLYASHEGLSREYEVSCPELDVLVELARGETAILGSRMMGGGFGGCTINLVRRDAAAELSQRLLAEYAARTGIVGEAYVVQPADGLEVLEPWLG